MDILNWLSLKRQQLIKTTPNNVKTDLIVLGAEVPFTQRFTFTVIKTRNVA